MLRTSKIMSVWKNIFLVNIHITIKYYLVFDITIKHYLVFDITTSYLQVRHNASRHSCLKNVINCDV